MPWLAATPEEIQFVRAQSLILEGTGREPVVQVPRYLVGRFVELITQSAGRSVGQSVDQCI